MSADGVPTTLDAIQAEVDATTPGPWQTGPLDDCPVGPDGDALFRVDGTNVAYGLDEDVAFIAHARTYVPRLVVALQSAIEVIDAYADERGVPRWRSRGITAVIAGEQLWQP